MERTTYIDELDFVRQLIEYRLSQYQPGKKSVPKPSLPSIDRWRLPLANFILQNRLTVGEASLLLIALAPHLQPDFFDSIIEGILPQGGNYPKLGGVRGKNSRSFLPTGETALFLLAGDDFESRLEVQHLFSAEHMFHEKRILWLEELPPGDPPMSGRIILSQDYADTFIHGRPSPPHFGSSFPARRLREKRSWSSLVINSELQDQIAEIIAWLKYNDLLTSAFGMEDRIKKGYRALFCGPPGTGKTLTAGLLGNELGKDVYKIDLSMVVSKYIGETERNLELLFARAEDKGWILFFDEADALFGKRTNVRDAHDKYANQEVSYLLQRIEDFDGLIILATNMISNIDNAFMRRFNAILRFPFPDANERALIWAKSFPENCRFTMEPDDTLPPEDGMDNGLNIPDLVKKYELAGGSIINAVHYASLKAMERLHARVNHNAGGDPENGGQPDLVISLSDVLQGIKRELAKEGKPFV
ncbi:MAG: AAA family ATPase [Cyclobacteriaceae bacterium]|nr:AAA family ATPase [Cyclobacteriaceae bacterium]